MALGNANTSAQARGKSKAVKVKRRREIVTARGYGTITSSELYDGATSACDLNASEVNKTYYHSGDRAVPVVGSAIYSRRRAGDRYLLRAGTYKISDGRGRFVEMTIDSNGQASNLAGCR